MWVGIIQLIGGPNVTKRSRENEFPFSLLELVCPSLPVFRYQRPWFSGHWIPGFTPGITRPWFSYPTRFPSSTASRLQTVGLINLQNHMSQCPLSSSHTSVYTILVLFLWTTLADIGSSQWRQQRALAWSWLSPWAVAIAPVGPGIVTPPSFESQGPILSLVIVSSLNSENDSTWVYLFSPLSVSCWGHDWGY